LIDLQWLLKKFQILELTRETEIDSFEIAWIARDIWENLIEEVKIIDIYENESKFWKGKKSVTIRITFRSLERTLENEEINEMYLKIREKLEKELEYELR
jgi:phenylalanyl-tRNA synthetase beta subunit